MAKAKPVKKNLDLQPTPGYVLIEPLEVGVKTESGIYLPDSIKKEKPKKGKVIAVGESTVTDFGIKKDSPVGPGKTVYYRDWGGQEIKIEGKDLLFIRFEDILGTEQ